MFTRLFPSITVVTFYEHCSLLGYVAVRFLAYRSVSTYVTGDSQVHSTLLGKVMAK